MKNDMDDEQWNTIAQAAERRSYFCCTCVILYNRTRLVLILTAPSASSSGNRETKETLRHHSVLAWMCQRPAVFDFIGFG
jgi:hypothetical protein